jgi:hypothetical protein
LIVNERCSDHRRGRVEGDVEVAHARVVAEGAGLLVGQRRGRGRVDHAAVDDHDLLVRAGRGLGRPHVRRANRLDRDGERVDLVPAGVLHVERVDEGGVGDQRVVVRPPRAVEDDVL